MSNDKQSMKLYTEEQLKEAFNCGRLYQGRQGDTNIYHLIDKLTPIEIPSDEGIRKIMELDDMEFDEFDPYDVAYLGGACWMRNKIQGGKK